MSIEHMKKSKKELREMDERIALMHGWRAYDGDEPGTKDWARPGQTFSGFTPPYTSDMNLAMELFSEMRFPCLEKVQNHNGWWEVYWYFKYKGKYHRTFTGGTTPAVAICEAWLEWKTTKPKEYFE